MTDASKFFEAAQTLAQSLSQWGLLIIAGSLVVIVSTAYYRPASRKVRAAYLLFLPAWSFLARSIYEGIQVQGSYVAYLVAARRNDTKEFDRIAQTMNDATAVQIRTLEYALLCLAGWLAVYIVWWVFSESHRGAKAQ